MSVKQRSSLFPVLLFFPFFVLDDFPLSQLLAKLHRDGSKASTVEIVKKGLESFQNLNKECAHELHRVKRVVRVVVEVVWNPGK